MKRGPDRMRHLAAVVAGTPLPARSVLAHASDRKGNAVMEPQGFCADGFEAIREAFASNFEAGEEVGAGACVVHDREVVDDLGG